MKINVLYFAGLREQAGRDGEERETTAATVTDLYRELRDLYGFTPPVESLRMAVNETLVASDHRLSPGDTVVFLPPVAGG